MRKPQCHRRCDEMANGNEEIPKLTSKMVLMILNAGSVVFARMSCETLQIRYQPFFVVHTVVSLCTTMTTTRYTLRIGGLLSANPNTDSEVGVLSIFLCAHTQDDNARADISTYSDTCNAITMPYGCDRYQWKLKRNRFDQFSRGICHGRG